MSNFPTEMNIFGVVSEVSLTKMAKAEQPTAGNVQ